MPEGHTIHRLAIEHRRRLAGEPLAVSSPQGRAQDAAAALNGGTITGIDAFGKHLLYRWRTTDDEPLTLHVHLGLFGRFRNRRTPPPEPRGQVRLRIIGAQLATDLSGPTACELMDPVREDELLARLGPDPLRDDGDPAAFLAALARRRIPIGQALLDQRVIAGIGNVYRAEALHLEGIDPYLPARELEPGRALALWDRVADQLSDGVRDGRIITRPGAIERAGKASKVRRREATCVYGQRQCHTCGGPVVREPLAGRTLWWCPVDQRESTNGPPSGRRIDEPPVDVSATAEPSVQTEHR
jgi:endonuclease-8